MSHKYLGFTLIVVCRWHLRFLQSDFKGQLPKQYSGSTSVVPSDMNDKNEEEPSRYVSDYTDF